VLNVDTAHLRNVPETPKRMACRYRAQKERAPLIEAPLQRRSNPDYSGRFFVPLMWNFAFSVCAEVSG
jgi:hypothetical protein